MNLLELKMIDTLKDLKENHHVSGIKAEFEAEGTLQEEALRLKEIVTKAGLDLTIKIGGCEAIKDMYDARAIGINAIVAPMIESPYAFQKYIQAVKMVFSDEERENMKFLINIETKYGFEYLEEILQSEYAQNLSGIVMGRTDMTGSLGMSRDDVNHYKIFEYADAIAKLTIKYNKEFVIGGGVSALSLPFFKRLPENSLSRFETRKVIFNAQESLKDENTDKGILKAFGFEVMWLKNKRELYGMVHKEDEERLQILESRYKRLIEEENEIYV